MEQTKPVGFSIPVRRGSVYVLRNPYFRHSVLKVGATNRTAEIRAYELARATGVPGHFEVLYDQNSLLPFVAEERVHESLTIYRDRAQKEFFDVPLKVAVDAVHRKCAEIDQLLVGTAESIQVCNFGSTNTRQLMELLAPFRGDEVPVTLVYDNGHARCTLPMPDTWQLARSNRLLELIGALNEVAHIRLAFRQAPEVSRLRKEEKMTRRR